MPTRRAFLRKAGAAAALGAGAFEVSEPVEAATAEDFDHYTTMPEHVSLEYEAAEAELETYAPELVQSTDVREKFIGLHGWKASSSEYDTDVYVYWAEYTHQDGWLGNLDSHHGDHEPVQVEVNSETGEVERVRASIYHWIKGEVLGSELILTDETHPRLRVLEPHHQYNAVEAGSSGEVPTVQDLTAAYPSWLSNDLDESVHPGTSTNPWLMQARGDWWRREETPLLGYGFSTDALVVKAAKNAGIDTVGSLSV